MSLAAPGHPLPPLFGGGEGGREKKGRYGLSVYISCGGRRTVEGSLRAGGGSLVARVTRDTHDCGVCDGEAGVWLARPVLLLFEDARKF